ncbi:DUF3667 domain-containing protein [Gracilimonas mengyeensis]|uniref:Yip1 domain-containing protein n=1 Tax=Gracilimonas mengyeensis TaxID=1302730 RepID=A0A521AT69_9BACT|nr:DUF3667 domain-containing protein [Gracilimonas mengyeensis]SMO37921.1 hypothetical protein SAMN06265219_101355 [Gracilimonas mengyeensis]
MALDFFHQFFGENSRLTRTFKDFINAGVYPRNWLSLKHQRYISPVRFFLIINLLYFLLLPLGGFDGFTTPFYSQLNAQYYSGSIEEIVLNLISQSGMSQEQFIAAFDSRVTGLSNSLLILMAPIVSFLLFVINFRKSRKAYHHLVTGLSFSSYIIFLALVVNLILVITIQMDQWLNTSIAHYIVDSTIFPAQIIITTLYGYYFFKRLYNDGFWITLSKALYVSFLILITAILAYRFLLLWITLYSVVLFP